MLLSISCITYNHAPFIRECLDGFLNQKTNFEFEILINDDCSTDGTAEIIRDYERQFPGKIKPVYQVQNQYSLGIRGMMARFNFPRAKGRYIALCEGDDYWIDPLKLQKQVDFLEMNPDYALCGHRVKELTEGIHFRDDFLVKDPGSEHTFIKEDLLYANLMHTPSVVFRNNFKEIPEWILKMPVGDYPLHIYNASFGKIKYLPEVMAVYRQHESSSWSSLEEWDRQRKWMITICRLVEFAGLTDRENEVLFRQLSAMFTMYRKECFYNNKTEDFLSGLAMLLENGIFRRWWFDNIFMGEFELMKQYPEGIQQSLDVLMKEIRKKLR